VVVVLEDGVEGFILLGNAVIDFYSKSLLEGYSHVLLIVLGKHSTFPLSSSLCQEPPVILQGITI